MALKTYGAMAVDWEQRVNMDRLCRQRLDRIKSLPSKSELGSRLAPNDDPVTRDFGSAAKHHQLHCTWIVDMIEAGAHAERVEVGD